MFPCNTEVPISGNFSNYTKVGNCSCAACDQACPAPPVDAFIGFFDGFNGLLVGLVYGGLILFSVGFQFLKQRMIKKQDAVDDQNEEDEPTTNYLPQTARVKNINESAITSQNNSRLLSDSFGAKAP